MVASDLSESIDAGTAEEPTNHSFDLTSFVTETVCTEYTDKDNDNYNEGAAGDGIAVSLSILYVFILSKCK